MATIYPEEERRRLAESYSRQMDGQLEKVAGQAYELTDIAREMLRAELAKRGLTPEFAERTPVVTKNVPPSEPGDPPPREPPSEETAAEDGEFEQSELVTIRQFRDLPDAVLAQGLLASAGIDAVLADDNLVRVYWFWSTAVGGVKLRVGLQNLEAATEILDQPIPESFDATGTGEYQLPRCPQCQSLDVTFRELNQSVTFLPAFLTFVVTRFFIVPIPIPIYRPAWRCRSCNAEWEDDEADAEIF